MGNFTLVSNLGEDLDLKQSLTKIQKMLQNIKHS